MTQSLWEEYRARGFTFVGVNIWDSDKDARKFVADFGLTFPVVRDEDGKVYLDYGVEQLPVALFMRSGLEVEQRYLGELKEGDLRAMLAKIAQPA